MNKLYSMNVYTNKFSNSKCNNVHVILLICYKLVIVEN